MTKYEAVVNENLILVINAGSSSLKITLFHQRPSNRHLERVLDGEIKGLNTSHTKLQIMTLAGISQNTLIGPLTIGRSLKQIFAFLKETYQIGIHSIKAIGHRFVHGGSHYTSTLFIDEKDLSNLKKLLPLAPLHNPACYEGIKTCSALFHGKIPQYAVFDTAYFKDLPFEAAHYAISLDVAKKCEIKRYGFHGISHQFLWDTYLKNVGTKKDKAITLHLGNGCSMTANDRGSPIDTSMGFTPDEGLIMGTRSGDIDAGAVEFLCSRQKKTLKEVIHDLNFASGLLGISGKYSDMQQLLKSADARSKLAINMFVYRIVKYLGSYIAALEGADSLIFSGGIGENSWQIRQAIAKKMRWCSVELDVKANKKAVGLEFGEVRKISSEKSKIALYVIATDENRFIAKEVQKCC